MDASDQDAHVETRLARVRGRVQGIGFREACVRRAKALGITGWVRNRGDGSVEAMLQGSSVRLDDMCAWLRGGMPAARVDSLEVARVESSNARFDRFERAPTL